MSDRDLNLALLLSKFPSFTLSQVRTILDSANGNSQVAEKVLRAKISRGSGGRGQSRRGGGSRGRGGRSRSGRGGAWGHRVQEAPRQGIPRARDAIIPAQPYQRQSRRAQNVQNLEPHIVSPSAADRQKPIVLVDNDYLHVVNNSTGEVDVVIGPQRYFIPSDYAIYRSKRSKIILHELEYLVVLNPFDETTGLSEFGSRAVIQGPLVRPLWPHEMVESNLVYKATILTENQGAVVMATRDFEDVDVDSGDPIVRRAGEMWIVKGACSWIPRKHETLLRVVDAVQISQFDAVYVRDQLTSTIRLVRGPKSFIPDVHEELYEKVLDNKEYEALEIPAEGSARAYELQIQKGQCVCVVDRKSSEERYVVGPEGLVLGPYEHVKVLTVAGGVPKVENQKKLAILSLGPDFFEDQFSVRTADNALLQLLVAYKWKFVVDDDNLDSMFRGDYIGYSCQSLRSRIREAASKHEFKVFNTQSSDILRNAIFKPYNFTVNQKGAPVTVDETGRFFHDFSFMIFGIDVKDISARDRDVSRLLGDSLKANMNVVVKKQQQLADHLRDKGKLVHSIEISKLRGSVIEQENANFKLREIERARIAGLAQIEGASAESEAVALIGNSRVELEMSNLGEKMELLGGLAGDAYLEFVRAKSLGQQVSNVTVVPSGTERLIIEE